MKFILHLFLIIIFINSTIALLNSVLCLTGSCAAKCNQQAPIPINVTRPVDANGCGTQPINIILNAVFEAVNKIERKNYSYINCCNKHDTCYTECNRTKVECDNLLLNCFAKQRTVAVLVGTIVLNEPFACCAFEQSQKDYCNCTSETTPACLIPDQKQIVSCIVSKLPLNLQDAVQQKFQQ
ncbi:group XIIA secretory phospholipase A2-like protein [Leptotrombidium deliense]|uniref:Group XIIA secretory phospholipase A2-like protein n=1 Tax=Leptotrombidium deliense TaxID=299467 RepID=A0A443RVE8_9ACAR|nr:group XIIA secretory phospholipase A2-like protein [Leptotrombidium deliense]